MMEYQEKIECHFLDDSEVKREQEPSGEIQYISQFCVWQNTEILCYVTIGNEKLEKDESAIACNVVRVNFNYLIKTSIALTMYPVLLQILIH